MVPLSVRRCTPVVALTQSGCCHRDYVTEDSKDNTTVMMASSAVIRRQSPGDVSLWNGQRCWRNGQAEAPRTCWSALQLSGGFSECMSAAGYFTVSSRSDHAPPTAWCRCSVSQVSLPLVCPIGSSGIPRKVFATIIYYGLFIIARRRLF